MAATPTARSARMRGAEVDRVRPGDPWPHGFASALMDWQRRAGRHGLPWQGTRDPYRVWLSEVMLQQTQVSTVLDYYPRFLARFPTVAALAEAPLDDVMALWSGLGYYSRARHLHRCAQQVVQRFGGVFPPSAEQLQTLPGIGASTAAAIAAFCHGERISIVDGNVRRVLSRLLAFPGDLAQAPAQRELWALAQRLLPERPTASDMVAYTQGLMDLGATVCARSRPACTACPVLSICRAAQQGTTDRYPVKTRTVQRRHESWWLLLLRAAEPGSPALWWLERRAGRGIWAGLFCPPVFADEASALAGARDRVGAQLAAVPGKPALSAQALPAFDHSLTHRELRLHPVLVDLPGSAPSAMATDASAGQWVSAEALASLGLPAPVRALLQRLTEQPKPQSVA